MAAPTIIDYTLISNGMFRFLGNIGFFWANLDLRASVMRRHVLVPWESQSLWDAAAWQTSRCHPAAAICTNKTWKVAGIGGRPEVSELLRSFLSVGERGSSVGAFMLSFYVLVLIWRLFILFVFLCSKNVECLLSAYSNRKMFKHWSLNTSNNCSFLVGT